MKCISINLCAFVLLLGCASHKPPATELTYGKASDDHYILFPDLPVEGIFIRDSRHSDGQYYVQDQLHSFSHTISSRSSPYPSFQFDLLFIHPDTGKLFSIISVLSPTEYNEGVKPYNLNKKALMSDDGAHWNEISDVQGIVSIIADPDNAGRVCIVTSGLRMCILQSNDDKYSSWTYYSEWNWNNRKYQCNPNQGIDPTR